MLFVSILPPLPLSLYSGCEVFLLRNSSHFVCCPLPQSSCGAQDKPRHSAPTERTDTLKTLGPSSFVLVSGFGASALISGLSEGKPDLEVSQDLKKMRISAVILKVRLLSCRSLCSGPIRL